MPTINAFYNASRIQRGGVSPSKSLASQAIMGLAAPAVADYAEFVRSLDYDPAPEAQTLLERLRRKRRQLGLSIAQAATLVGVNESTCRAWELGRGKPLKHSEAVKRLLDLRMPDHNTHQG